MTNQDDSKISSTGVTRLHPRTFPYQRILPYETETRSEVLAHLDHIISNLYVAIKGDDLIGVIGRSVGSATVHWTKELMSWIELKFDLPMETRITLARLYFSLSLSGIDHPAGEKFVNMFYVLVKDDTFQDTVTADKLNLDWKLLVIELKKLADPQNMSFDGNCVKAFGSLSRLAHIARQYLDPQASMQIMKEVLPLVSVRAIFFCYCCF